MALFTNSPEDWERLDWQILRDGGIALYWRPEYLSDDLQWLKANRYDVYDFACEEWSSEDQMYSGMERILRFSDWWGPEWGHNLDALDDCLTDLPIPADGGAVLVFHQFNLYASGSGSALMHSGRTEAEALLDVMAGISRFMLLNSKRFIVLVHTEDPSIQIGLLGGASPVWNRREWLNRNRTPESSLSDSR
ncbi:MAG TPA: barstar family protein [Candidatus Angelobacter sp.]|nr:barstar family protein [Candidatus Angelobacter sp.]